MVPVQVGIDSITNSDVLLISLTIYVVGVRQLSEDYCSFPEIVTLVNYGWKELSFE